MKGDERRFGFDSNRGTDYTPEQIAFMQGLDRWKRLHQLPNPSWHDVYQAIYAMGYRLVAEPTALPDCRGR